MYRLQIDQIFVIIFESFKEHLTKMELLLRMIVHILMTFLNLSAFITILFESSMIENVKFDRLYSLKMRMNSETIDRYQEIL